MERGVAVSAIRVAYRAGNAALLITRFNPAETGLFPSQGYNEAKQKIARYRDLKRYARPALTAMVRHYR
jgi:hypothetical protein